MEQNCISLNWNDVFEYVAQQLIALGFQQRGKLLIRRTGVLIMAIYYDRSCPSMPDFRIGVYDIWSCPLEWHNFRDGHTARFRHLLGRMLLGEAVSPSLPVRVNGKYPIDAFKKYEYAMEGKPVCWDEFCDMLDRTLFSAISYLSDYEGYKENICYRPAPGLYNRGREWILAFYERNLDWASYLVENDLAIKKATKRYPEQWENILQSHLAIVNAAKVGDWMPAQKCLDERRVPREALLKRYHIRDNGQ